MKKSENVNYDEVHKDIVHIIKNEPDPEKAAQKIIDNVNHFFLTIDLLIQVSTLEK